MTSDALGKIYSLLNAVSWAAALVLFRRSGEHLSPLALNLFKNVVGLLLIAGTIALAPVLLPLVVEFLPALAAHASDTTTAPATLLDPAGKPFWILVISGVIGIAIADTIFFYSLNLAGVGLIAIADCTYTPLVMLFSWLLLAEPMGPLQFVGAGLIVSAVFLSTGHAPPPNRTRGQILSGIGGAVLAVALMAFGIVFAKPVLEGAPILWTSGIRLAAGIAALLLLAPWAPGLRQVRVAFRPSRVWAWSVPAAVCGAYLAMIFWVAGFALTKASVAAMLNQCSSVFALIIATIALREQLTVQKAIAICLALGGVAVVVFDEHVATWWRHMQAQVFRN